MSNTILPSLNGLAWNVGVSPAFNTVVHRAASGKEARAALMAFPLWTFSLDYEVLSDGLRGTEFRQMAGFFLARQGSFDSFLFTNPIDYSVTDQVFGTGDGTTTQFQLLRAIGSGNTFLEPVQNVNVLTNIKVAGVAQASPANYSIDANGLVTFVTPPTGGQSLTWTGSYYYRCRFNNDNADFNIMLKDLIELRKLDFVGSPANKV